jgi:hypothetical protein
MKVRYKLLWIAPGITFVCSIAYGQEILVAGPQGHSTSMFSRAPGSPEGGLSYWDYRNHQQSGDAAARSRQGTGLQYGASIRYAGGFNIRRGVNRLGTFRYYSHDYSKQRFADLRRSTRPDRFTVPRSQYRPGARYTTSFNARQRGFVSSIRYGFR